MLLIDTKGEDLTFIESTWIGLDVDNETSMDFKVEQDDSYNARVQPTGVRSVGLPVDYKCVSFLST